MGRLAVLALRAVLVMLAAGTVFVQAVMVPLFATDLEDLDAQYAHLRVPLLAVTVLGVAAALLVFALGVVLAPGEAVPPGMVLLIGGAGVGVLGVALIVLVLRMLLAQAVARDVEAAHMQAELDEVI
ncbi:DUF2975 domain-containing protein [Streptomyces sp. H27-G5]|uniref:DUF2975 domain-containing protein n=1 Tax=Streptomyces sp. H27-G5 TaxID=2996698 RepID=UPI00226DBDD8|nr:DUF2975 domain-containing protein [Streptomyces sp. H27-G5]MCY0923732.1 DUF2975 domain-containing protein [Streptomyces sp. H27-G5]